MSFDQTTIAYQNKTSHNFQSYYSSLFKTRKNSEKILHLTTRSFLLIKFKILKLFINAIFQLHY